jgi:hypothetical protein
MSDIDEPWADVGYKTIGERIREKDSEIERLKAENEITVRVCNENTDLKTLITELADALSHYALLNDFEKSLLQRAREATR